VVYVSVGHNCETEPCKDCRTSRCRLGKPKELCIRPEFIIHKILSKLAECNSLCGGGCYSSVWGLIHLQCYFMPSVIWRCWLGGRKGIWPVKNWVLGCWRGCVSGSRCRFAYGPADATATLYLAPVNPYWFNVSGAGLPGWSRTKSKRAVKLLVCVWFYCISVYCTSHTVVFYEPSRTTLLWMTRHSLLSTCQENVILMCFAASYNEASVFIL